MRIVCRMPVLVAVLTGLLVPATVGTGAPAAAGRRTGPPGGTSLWVARYTPQGPDGPADAARAIAVSPDGSQVFVTGAQTVGYAAATGKRLWASTVGTGQAVGSKIAVSPDGMRVFVTGTVSYPSGASQYITTAYNATTGARLWQSVYGPPTGTSSPTGIGVSPDGSTVFVTGASSPVTGDPTARRYGTVAYNATTGAQRWAVRCCISGVAQAESLAVSPNGSQVYVTGFTVSPSTPVTYTTIAYDTATGAEVWARRYDEAGNDAFALSAVVSPDGTRVYVTGEADGPAGIDDTTVAYSAASGTQLWVAHFGNMPSGSGAVDMAISKDGTELVVTGTDGTASGHDGYRTVAYRANDGQQLWTRFYLGPEGSGEAASVAISPTGSRVFVTGSVALTSGSAYETVAYCATTGAQLWASSYMGPVRNGLNAAAQVVVSPDGSRVFVTGVSTGYSAVSYATLAYQA